MGSAFPGLLSGLDAVTPRALLGELQATRRFTTYYMLAADEISAIIAAAKAGVSPRIVESLLRRQIVVVPFEAPSPDGRGIVLAMVNMTRLVTGPPPMSLHLHMPDADAYDRFLRVTDRVLFERESAQPLEHAMKVLELTSTDMGRIMGVTRQAIEKWRLSGPPAERSSRLITIDEIATILQSRLKPGYVPTIVRRPARAFEHKSFLEVLAEGREDDVLEKVKESFDYSSVA